MFDPYLAQREKEIDRLQAMARADRHRLAKQARGPRLSAWWRLHARVGAALRTLVALAWVAAGFLYELGITLEWEEVRFLARLGGWAERKGNRPGKIVLTRGLRRIADMLATQAFLEGYREEHGALPPQIAAWLAEPPPQEL